MSCSVPLCMQIGDVLLAGFPNPETGRYQNILSRNPKMICEVLGHGKDLVREGMDVFLVLSRETAMLQGRLSLAFIVARSSIRSIG